MHIRLSALTGHAQTYAVNQYTMLYYHYCTHTHQSIFLDFQIPQNCITYKQQK